MLIRWIKEWFRNRRLKKEYEPPPLKEGLDALNLPFDWNLVSTLLMQALIKGQWYLNKSDFQRLLAELGKYGFEGYKVGEFKLTFLHRDGWVVKMPYSPKGKEQLRREAFIVKGMDDVKALYFPDIYMVGDYIMIQRRYDPDLKQYTAKSPEITAIGKRYSVPDVYHKNVGFDEDGRWYFIDFGA